MKTKLFTLLIFALCLNALRISPGAFTATGIPTGVEKDFGIDLTVYNTSNKEARYAIKVLPPQDIKSISIEGYRPLPDPSFIYFKEGDTITVPPNGKKGHRILSNFPDSMKNSHFVAQLSVEPVESGMFNTVILPTYFLETESDGNTLPQGLIFAPSVVRADSTKPTLHNNTDQDIEVNLSLITPDPAKKGLNYDNSPGFNWLKGDNLQIEGEKSFTLKSNSKMEITLSYPDKLTGEILLFANNTFTRILLPPPPLPPRDTTQ